MICCHGNSKLQVINCHRNSKLHVIGCHRNSKLHVIRCHGNSKLHVTWVRQLPHRQPCCDVIAGHEIKHCVDHWGRSRSPTLEIAMCRLQFLAESYSCIDDLLSIIIAHKSIPATAENLGSIAICLATVFRNNFPSMAKQLTCMK